MNDDSESPDSDQTELIDQYTAYVNTTLNVSNRRMRNNRFYVLLLSGTLAVLSVLTDTQIIEEVGLLLAGLLGFALCILWYLSIVSYKQLNSGKYKVINSMEDDLPAEPFADEWEILDEGDNWRNYITHTRVERKIPFVLAIPYLLISVYALSQII
ncbi:RipA family octameric membrane protein [Halolamina salina]|uniref:Small integral membrane protein n=1 Tax=Halolamina salina TaxID=1220023 RepID=A0ABD6BAK3_9EURY